MNQFRTKLVLLGLFAMTGGCRRDYPVVRFILPNGYRGVFTIALDEEMGRIPMEHNDVTTIVVGKSGTVRLRSLSCLEEWHEEVAEFQDGTRLPLLEVSSQKSVPRMIIFADMGSIATDITDAERKRINEWRVIGTGGQVAFLRENLAKVRDFAPGGGKAIPELPAPSGEPQQRRGPDRPIP